MYHLVGELLQPFVLLYLLAGLLLLALWRRGRERRRMMLVLTITFAVFYLCATPLMSYLALGSLEWSQPPLDQRPTDTPAIVILAGYARSAAGENRPPELGEDTLSRCLEGARLYRQGDPCPIVVSGGTVDESDEPACAPLMRDFLARLGVPTDDVIVEDRSRTTWENAVESNKLLEQRGIRKVVLVTDAAHMFRAAGCFRKQGLEVVCCGCRYRATGFSLELRHFLPNPGGACGIQYAWHEWLGIGYYWLRGRL
ncbi:MAG TPA: YdcF family protein [Gemmataceae bacterium]|jgi:uncharacterized SAM-binding protein YcdF (DUF218 family)